MIHYKYGIGVEKDENKLGILPVVLGYHLEWELSGEVVSATIFDGATRTGISETGARELDDMAFGGEGPPTWPPESYRRKRTYVLELGTRGRKTIVAPNAG
ncbi:hypothetical protein C2G38_2177107 [Gigaspora rosea]|uniref:Uncharacterized protein n=1 Tax=Gigaspora rosea TaxID=44941 RepID=A0A397VFN6_9GLOM|nr:hypothetical protein C2G38_2177107 [Gigaspora rosea]